MHNVELTLDQYERLKALLSWTQTDVSALGETQGRQVKMLTLLLDRIEGKVIASSLGIGRSTVSNFKTKVSGLGIEPLLKKWEAMVQRYKTKLEKHFGSRKSGAIDTTNKWIDGHNPHNEPAIAIAQMVIGPGCNYVIFAVRHFKSDSSESVPFGKSFPRTVREIFKDPIIKNPPWTRISHFDAKISKMFWHLTNKYRTLERPAWVAELPDPIPNFTNAFGSEFEFFIIAQGDMAERYFASWQRMAETRGEKLNPHNFLLVNSAEEFFQRLESTIYRLRERWSCAGLLPDFFVPCVLVEKWAQEEDTEPLLYTAKGEIFNQILKINSLLWRYPALYGGLFHMSPKMWSRLPFKGEFTLTVSNLRPNIVIKPVFDEQEGGMLFMSVEIIPQISFTYMALRTFSSHESVRKMERSLRNQFRENGRATRFSYSTNPLLVVRDMAPIGVEHDGVTLPNLENVYSVLVPRHFVATDETLVVPLCDLHALAKCLKEGVSWENFIVEGVSEPSLIFYAPSLLSGIRTAYEKNIYGGIIYTLECAQARNALHLGKEGDDLLNRIPTAPIYFQHPSYWCLDPAQNGPENSESPDAWRRKSIVNTLADPLNIPHGEVPPTRPPADAIERGFGNVLSDLDADFLYCHLLPEDRAAVDRLADSWEEQVKTIINSRYDIETPSGRNLVLASLGYELAKGVTGRKTELRSLVYAVLEEFAKNSRRVIRKAIEVMQRCLLAGLDPVPLVVETETSLSKMFYGFLEMRAKSKLIEHKKPPFQKDASKTTEKPEDENNAFVDEFVMDSEQSCDSYENDIRTETELVALVITFVKKPRDQNFARSFAGEAKCVNMRIWRDVLVRMAELENGPAIRVAVEKGLDLCRGPEGRNLSPDAKITGLMDLFAEIPKQEKPPSSRSDI